MEDSSKISNLSKVKLVRQNTLIRTCLFCEVEYQNTYNCFLREFCYDCGDIIMKISDEIKPRENLNLLKDKFKCYDCDKNIKNNDYIRIAQGVRCRECFLLNKIKNCLSCENEIKEDLTPVLSNYCKICAFNKINYKKSR